MSEGRPIALAAEIGRVPSMTVALTSEQEERFDRLMASIAMVDVHQHPMVLADDVNELVEYFNAKDWRWGYDAVREGGWTAVGTANGLAPLGSSRELATIEFRDLAEEIGLMLADVERHDMVSVVKTADEVLAAREAGKIGFIPTVEHLGIGTELHRVDVLYGLGVRIAGLTYSRDSPIGGGQYDRTNRGLSDLGLEVVKRMNRLGMIIDVSHASPATALETIELSEHPVIFSHNASATLWKSRRTRDDSDFAACAAKGGLICITAVPNSMSDDPKQDINCVLDHYDHLIGVVGADHVGIGTDTLIGDHVAVTANIFHRGPAPIPPAPYIDGLESPADGKNVIRGLIARGHSDEAIRKVAGENILALMRQVLSH